MERPPQCHSRFVDIPGTVLTRHSNARSLKGIGAWLSGEYSTLPRRKRKKRAPQRGTYLKSSSKASLARSRLPKDTDLPDTALWTKQLDEFQSLDMTLQEPPPPYNTDGVADGAAASKLLQVRHV